MRKTACVVDRYEEPESNGPLVYKRDYVEVVAAERDGILYRMRPSRRAERDQLLTDIFDLYDAAQAALLAAFSKPPAPGTTVFRSPQHVIRSYKTLKSKERYELFEHLSGYSIKSLRAVRSAFIDGKGDAFSSLSNTSESTMLERISYYGVIGNGPSSFQEATLNDVRASHPNFAYEDLSGLDGVDRLHAESIMTVSRAIRNFMYEKFRTRHTGAHSSSLPDNLGHRLRTIRSASYISPALALVIMDFPDRTTEIINYIVENRMPRDDGQTGHLREVLNNSCHALSIGVL